MRMLEYITEIQRQFIEVYGFPKGDNGCPQNVPDGEYPMQIEGKTDYVRIAQGLISCCNWNPSGGRAAGDDASDRERKSPAKLCEPPGETSR